MQYVKGPLLVLGGAGSGKTSLLASKIAWLIREYGISPSHVLAVAANAHTARLLRARVADLIGYQVPNLWISTFGDLGLTLLQSRLDTFGLRPGFSLYDPLDSQAVVSRLLHDAYPSLANLAGAVAQQIAQWKRDLALPPDAAGPGMSAAETAARLYRRYEQQLRTANAIDAEDLVRKAVQLLRIDADLLSECRARIQFLLVDEYERTSTAEHELVRLLVAEQTVLTAVGDENQFFGAAGEEQPTNLARLPQELTDLRVLRFAHNYRSTVRISRAAASLVSAGRAVAPAPGDAPDLGQRLQVLRARTELQEADGVVNALLDHKRRHGTDYRDYAVLYLRPEQAGPLERSLQAHQVPYYRQGGSSLFDQTEVRDLCSYLRLLCNPSDDIAFLRAINTPRRDIDRATIGQLMHFAAARGRPLLECALDADLVQTLPPGRDEALREVAILLHAFSRQAMHADPVQLVHDLIAELRYEEWLRDACNDVKIAGRRMQNVMELIGRLRRIARQRPEADLRGLVTQLMLDAAFDPEAQNAGMEGIILMPLMAAKGLEFAHVYVVGFEEGLIPDAAETKSDINERRRAYLAVSRARHTLTFTLAEHRRFIGDIAARRPSRFLSELVAEDLEWIDVGERQAGAESVLGRAMHGLDGLSLLRR